MPDSQDLHPAARDSNTVLSLGVILVTVTPHVAYTGENLTQLSVGKLLPFLFFGSRLSPCVLPLLEAIGPEESLRITKNYYAVSCSRQVAN